MGGSPVWHRPTPQREEPVCCRVGVTGRCSANGDAQQLAGMPQPFELRRDVVESTVVVSYGGELLATCDRDDQGVRNFAIVSLAAAGRPWVEVAKLFGVGRRGGVNK